MKETTANSRFAASPDAASQVGTVGLQRVGFADK